MCISRNTPQKKNTAPSSGNNNVEIIEIPLENFNRGNITVESPESSPPSQPPRGLPRVNSFLGRPVIVLRPESVLSPFSWCLTASIAGALSMTGIKVTMGFFASGFIERNINNSSQGANSPIVRLGSLSKEVSTSNGFPLDLTSRLSTVALETTTSTSIETKQFLGDNEFLEQKLQDVNGPEDEMFKLSSPLLVSERNENNSGSETAGFPSGSDSKKKAAATITVVILNTVISLSFGILQCTLLNLCLYYFDALVCVPMYAGLSLVIQNCFGVIFFEEYKYFHFKNIVGILGAVALNMLGMAMLNLKKQRTSTVSGRISEIPGHHWLGRWVGDSTNTDGDGANSFPQIVVGTPVAEGTSDGAAAQGGQNSPANRETEIVF